jgi:hypothetical protein
MAVVPTIASYLQRLLQIVCIAGMPNENHSHLSVRHLPFLSPPKTLSCYLAFWFLPLSTLWPTNSLTPVPRVLNSCFRFPPASVVLNPPALFSQNGYLSVRFSYQTRTDDEGRTLFSFMTPDGLENPTLYVHPGDHLIVTITTSVYRTLATRPKKRGYPSWGRTYR